MAESCIANTELSRKCQTAILQRLASVSQKAAGDAIGKSETWVSRFASEQLKSCADLLAAIGLKVVPVASVCYPPDHIEHLEYFARIGMARSGDTSKLDWSEE